MGVTITVYVIANGSVLKAASKRKPNKILDMLIENIKKKDLKIHCKKEFKMVSRKNRLLYIDDKLKM